MTNPISAYATFAREVYARPSLAALLPEKDTWDELLFALENATQALSEVPPLPDSRIVREVSAALRSGEPVPADFADRRVAEDRSIEVRGTRIRILEGLQSDYRKELIAIAESSTEEILTGLADELSTVLDRAEALLTDLGGVIDPLAAIKSGKTAEYQDFVDVIHPTYLRIRTDADLVYKQEDGALLRKDPGRRFMRRFDALWTTFGAADHIHQAEGWTYDLAAPWPDDFSSLDFFVWLVGHRADAEPWIPSTESMGSVNSAPILPVTVRIPGD